QSRSARLAEQSDEFAGYGIAKLVDEQPHGFCTLGKGVPRPDVRLEIQEGRPGDRACGFMSEQAAQFEIYDLAADINFIPRKSALRRTEEVDRELRKDRHEGGRSLLVMVARSVGE